MFRLHHIGELAMPFLASTALLAAFYFTVTHPAYWAFMKGIFA